MKKSLRILVSSLVFVVIFLACTLPGSTNNGGNNSNTGSDNNSGNNSGGDDTVADTDTPPPPSPDDTATATNPPPADTQVPSATTVCDLVHFVSDVTVPDGTQADAGQVFPKTWRLRNAGSCTWTSGYDLVFHSGDAMGAPAAVQLTSGTVAPGATVDVTVNLTAPGSPGTYKGFFKLRNGSGVVFGMPGPFWVEIKVKNPTATDPPPPVAKADMIITVLELSPSTPTKGASVEVTINTYNIGNAVSGPYHVAWYPGENYPSPACEWDVANSNPGGGRVLTCTYAGYPSWYGSITTLAIVDTNDTVDESNEGNNSAKLVISVNP